MELQEHGSNRGDPRDIDLDLAYEYHTLSSGSVIVALLDDGFVSHEDFPQSRIIGGFDYAQQDFTISPGRYGNHGMACVGQIAGTGYNSVGIAGIALYAKILGQKIVRDNLIFAITDTELARAFSDAVLSGARVINNSWGCAPGVDCGFSMDSTTYWIRKADSAGVLVVFAAGNEGALMRWPADLEEVVAVGATDHRDMKQPESSYGSQLDIMAPSGLATGTFGNVWTLDQMGFDGVNPDWYTCTPQNMSYDCKFGGTSAACAQASGVAAMILQRRPDLVGNTEMLKKILRYSSERTPFDKLPTDTARVDDYVGWGRLNAARALLSVVRGDANNTGSITSSDVVYLNNYIFNFGPAPVPHVLCGDADGNGAVSISDCVKLVQYIFGGGSAPPVSFKY